MSHLIKNVHIKSYCPNTKKNISWVFRVTSSGRKERFPLAAYNRLKKERSQELALALVEQDAKISKLKLQLDEKATELEALNSKLHKTEEHIRRQKRKVCINYILFRAFPMYNMICDHKCKQNINL